MAEVVMPSQPSPGMSSTIVDDHCDIDGNCSPYSLNQAFAFPPQQPPTSTPTDVQQSLGASRVIAHRPRPSNLALSELPPFEFGSPGSPASLRYNPSPTRSPVRLTPPVHAGHKRAGSEFVGGALTGTGPVLVPTTATDDMRPPSAPSSPVRGPPSNWRGHAHRRSHAVSQGDLKSMMHPPLPNLSGSLPVTPSEDPTKTLADAPIKSTSYDPISVRSHSRPNIPPVLPNQIRPRVEFSETPEFIPRPLSTISSETSSSMSTVRINHSFTESISSLHKTGSRNSSNGLDFQKDVGKSGAPETSSSQHGRIQEALGLASPDPESGVDAASFFDFETASRSFQATKPTLPGLCSDECPSPHTNLIQASPPVRPKSSPDLKSPFNSPRISGRVDNFMHRSSKPSSKEQLDLGALKRANAMQQFSQGIEVQEPRFSLENITFDDDTTTIIEEPSTSGSSQRTSVSQMGTHFTFPSCPTPNPVIDIDFAMSFPDDSIEEDHSGRASGSKRRLHSSGETGGFSGPGMHYHRRTESAPEMDTYEGSRFGFPRLGSNPALEEAIVEEDEEPDSEDNLNGSHVLGLGVNIVDEDLEIGPTSTSDMGPRQGSRRVIRRILTPPDMIAVQPVKIVDLEDEPRFSMITKSSDESSITPTVTPDPFATRPASAPLDFAVQTTNLVYGSTPETPSTFSPSEYRQPSFEFREPRLNTARSSLAERSTLNSSKAGNMSAASSEDVPSLTSSASTVMSGLPPRMAGDSAMRSASFSGPVTSRARPGSSSKRASLASLSKLMGGPYNKSKLNIAETLRPDSPSPEKSNKKKHRISRMVKFWKTKEPLSDK